MSWWENSLGVKKLQAKITLRYESAVTAAALARAVSPDNTNAPVGLTVKTTAENQCVVTLIELQGKLATFIATLDDLLECASTAEKALGAVKKRC